MNVEEIRAYCLSKHHVEESLPFGPDVLVFKSRGKEDDGIRLHFFRDPTFHK